MRYCKKCLEPDTRPDCVFDDGGVCLPCRYAELKETIDWDARWRQLEELAAWGRERNVSGYDCIVPVSGGKDSTCQAMLIRDKLGLKPLLISSSFPPDQITKRAPDNLENLVSLGFDCQISYPAPGVWRRLLRHAFLEHASIYRPSELALLAIAPMMAIYYRIPLVFYGENPALQWGSAGGSTDGDANTTRDLNTISGGDMTPYLKAGFTEEEMYFYRYPTNEAIERAELKMIYIGYYLPDFNDIVNTEFAVEHGLIGRSGEDAVFEDIGQISVYDSLECDFLQMNQFLKYVKFGFGKTSEQCSGLIRLGAMSREEALEKTLNYAGRCAPRYIRRFCKHIGITEDAFWEVVENNRNQDIWERDGNEWRLRYPPS